MLIGNANALHKAVWGLILPVDLILIQIERALFDPNNETPVFIKHTENQTKEVLK